MSGGFITKRGQFLIHTGQQLASLCGKFFLFEQFRNFNQAFRAALLPLSGAFLVTLQAFDELADGAGSAQAVFVGRGGLRVLCFIVRDLA